MVAMEPVWKFLHNLEGFEFTAFWFGFLLMVGLAGFFLDYVMQKQGFGAFFNSLFVLGSIFAGLYLRYNYLQPNQFRWQFHDPYLTISAIFAILVPSLVVTGFVRNKFS